MKKKKKTSSTNNYYFENRKNKIELGNNPKFKNIDSIGSILEFATLDHITHIFTQFLIFYKTLSNLCKMLYKL